MHPSIHKLELDVVNDKSVKLVVDHVIEREGKIDVLVNNAGVSLASPSQNYPPTDHEISVQVPAFGNLYFQSQRTH